MTTRTAAVALALATLMGCSQGLEPNLDNPKPDGNNPDNSPRKSFIITLAPKNNAARVAADYGIEPQFVYSHVMTGFAGSISEAARSGLLKDARVVRVDPDEVFGVDGGGSQPGAPWGLDRIDQRSSLDGKYTYGATGKGVTTYIVDTGIRFTHQDFGGRASFGFDAFGEDGSDCHGHGTHVAGTVGGTKYGVAKEVNLVSVRVLSCTGAGTAATVIAGLDWIAANAVPPAVANLSLGGGVNDPVDAAVRRTIEAGVTVVLAAGNSTKDACFVSPARVTEAMTVGASDNSDVIATFSNWGTCVDWYAPGVGILSSAFTGDDAAVLKSGTSMAAPHTAGAAAIYLEVNPAASPHQVGSALAAAATPRAISSVPTWKGSTTGALLYTGTLSDGGSGNAWPIAKFSVSCTGTACSFVDQSADSDGSITSWQWDFGDQGTSTAQNPSHTYAATGTYRVALTVRDNAGATATVARDVSVGDAPTSNQPPIANFSASCLRMACDFVDASQDPDGTISKWQWSFGDGSSGVETASTSPSHVFHAGGVYRVTLTVTDNLGASSSTSKDLPVGLVVSATGQKVKGRPVVDVTWKGAESSRVTIYLNGAPLATVSNTGGYTYQSSKTGQASFVFQVCETGIESPICSQELKLSL